MDFSVLGIYNKWWQSRISVDILEKELIGKYEAAAFKRNYKNFFDYKTNGLYILRGPRQIGKSTLLKYTIFDLLKRENRRAIFYLPLDTVKDYIELRDILLSYLHFAATEKKRYIFIDEISMVKDWQRAIKELRDNTALKDDFVVLTGSSAWDIKRSSERLPGRKGNVKSNVLLLPLTFSEYFKTTMYKITTFSIDEILNFDETKKFELDLLTPDVEQSFYMYLESGGIPSVIECVNNNGDLDSILDSGWDTMIGDVEKEGLTRSKLMGVLEYLSQRLSQRFSWTSAASNVGIDTKTFQNYVDTMGYNYVAMTIKAIDKNSLLPLEKKQKKVYYYDNFVLKNIERKFGIIQKKPAVIESVVAQNLVFKFSDWLEEGLCNLQNVGYWYSSGGKEVDFIVNGIPIELKYQNVINRSDIMTIKKTFGKGIILSKKTLDLSGDVKIIPVYIFLGII